MASKTAADLSIGRTINYEQSTPVGIRFLEDVLLSQSEEFWMDVIVNDETSSDWNLMSVEDSFPATNTPTESNQIWILEPGSIENTFAMTATDQYVCGVSSQLEPSSETDDFNSDSFAKVLYRSEGAPSATDNESENDEDGVICVGDDPQKAELDRDELGSIGADQLQMNLNADVKGSCDNTKMFVRPSSDGTVKKLCCPFCLKLYPKLARHLEDMHETEDKVREFINLPKRSRERRRLQDDLRKLGLKKWNGNAELNKNEFIPSRRPSGNVIESAVKWTICPYCLGPYTKTNLRHHTAQFHKNPMKGHRTLNKLATIVEGRLHENASNRLAHVMGFMRQDHIVQIIKYDWLLIVYGNKLCCKYTPHYQENMIRARLRLTGRLLFEIKKIDPNVTDFASIFHVERYSPMVDAIKVIGRFDPETSEFGAPAMSSISVTFIKQIGKYLSAECIRRRDRENKIETDDFLTYMDTDIDISINKLVAETQAKMRRRKLQNIPTMQDVKMLIQYINTERNVCMEKLSIQYSYEYWHKLGQLNMAWIIVFNRRRVGEVQNILIDEFLGRQSIDDDTNQQLIAKLSDESKSIARKFKRMKIRGKKGRTVPVLLKPAIEKAINMFVHYREAAGVSADSKYLFELPSSTKLKIKVVDGCQTLRKFSELCGAENPTSLRGTNLRKHMATTCVSLELNDAMISEVSKYMGHDEKIHRDTYRQNTIDREVVQIAQVLEAAVGECDMEDDGEDDCVGGEVWPALENENGSTMAVTDVEAVPHGNHDDEEDVMIEAGGQNLNLKRKFVNIEGEPVKTKFPKMRWTNDEIACVRKAFVKHLKGGTLPTQFEIEKRQEEDAYASLRSRTWQQIKAYVNNQQKKKK